MSTYATGAYPLILIFGASFTMTILRLLARQTRIPGAIDNSRYSERAAARASPRSFLTHHVAKMPTTRGQQLDLHRHFQAADAPKPSSTPPARASLCVSYQVI